MLKASYLCARCLVDQATHALELAVEDPGERLSIMRGVVDLLHKDYPERIPAEIGTMVHRYVMERSGKDPYASLKMKSNEAALMITSRMRRENLTLRKVVLSAIAGNAIDFGVDGSRDALHSLEEQLQKGLAIDHFNRFEAEVGRAESILYLTDNCGEIAFDQLLVEYLVGHGKEVTVSPKQEPILNDATVQDLISLGFGRMEGIIPHARNAIGLMLSEASGEFLKVWDRADLVIAKGMGHFETLYGTDKNIAYLLKAKCIPVAKSLGVEQGDHVLTF